MGTAVSNIADSCTPNTTLDLSGEETLAAGLGYSRADRILITAVNPCILAVGLLGNLAFLFMQARVPRMRTVTNTYLTHLALADTTFLTVGVSEKIARYRTSPVNGDQSALGPGGCIVVYVLLDVAYCVGLCLVTLVTVEKYYAICRPIQHRLIGGKKRTNRLVLMVWVIAWTFALGLLPCWTNFIVVCTRWPSGEAFAGHPPVVSSCMPEAQWLVDFRNGLQAVPFFVSLLVNAVLYALIIRSLNTRVGATPVTGTAGGGGGGGGAQVPGKERQQTRRRIRNQVTWMLIINGAVFFALMAPFQCSSFAFVISNQTLNYVLSTEQVERLMWVTRTLLYLNPAINPYIYAAFNKRYRKAYVQAFTFRRRNRRLASATVMEDMSTFVP